ncbi:biotin-dependent carboxyltransferase family protein [Chelatococcus asaccharovorans]|uniref:5-oxoprolinase subunit C family protein n=1 Tax=Chelatococcus asaccharovorans TaxID=28210 RepID=UPI000D770EE2|nr:biotin-dependent carboxyltransferase family protein [Chelatococcus asaccharovorans]MBS7702803.1 biotin-dependent carboxyltransferase family protein [Chelatococcus asaccharovorans]
MIEILSVLGPASVQDLGRVGQYRFGVGTSGAMDDIALRAGNILLGNDENAAGVEIAFAPFKLRFNADAAFALTGADGGAELNGRLLPPWWRACAHAGDILVLKAMSRGARSYLTVAGGIDVPLVLGSRSTQLRGEFGGFHGRALQPGDILPCDRSESPDDAGELGAEPADIALRQRTLASGARRIRVIIAGEYDRYDEAARQLFWHTDWRVTPQSNRYGYRLEGPPVQPIVPIEKRSHGIVPGVIQIPPNGQPIIQLRDAQTSGGYPKFATVVEADLWRIGQAGLGSRLRFEPISHQEALAAQAEVSVYLERLRASVRLQGEL